MKHVLAAIGLLFAFSPEAGAVLPSLVGPLQALIALLPQLAVVAIAALGAVFGLRRRPAAVGWIAGFLSGHKRAAIVTTVVLCGGTLVATAVICLWPRSAAVAQRPIADGGFPSS